MFFMQQERIDIEEKYANLQEEAAGKTKKLKKVWSMLMSAKSEVSGKKGIYTASRCFTCSYNNEGNDRAIVPLWG